MNARSNDSKDDSAQRSSRGTSLRPPNRFEATHRVEDPELMDIDPSEDPSPATQIFADKTQTVLSENDSPDVGFDWSLNPYRGCEHGCAYCYARPTHEYLGWNAGVDFETRILAKPDAPERLREALARPGWTGQRINLSGVTDCYQPIERKLEITRRCLAVLAEFRQAVTIITKNALILRDLDYLGALAQYDAVGVMISLTTLDPDLRRRMEPRASPPIARLRAIERLAAAGVNVGVLMGPVIPAINDHEMPAIMKAAAAAGAKHAGYVLLRLPLAVGPIFEDWVGREFPDRKEKVLNQVRGYREGEINDARFGVRMRGVGAHADRLRQIFEVSCRRAGLKTSWAEPSEGAFRRVERGQGELF